METKFNFKSQTCTHRNQSERLLALGLKKETADCTLRKVSSKVYVIEAMPFCEYVDGIAEDYIGDSYIPAWSLHRLILMTPKELIVNNGVIFPFRGTALMDLTINDCDLYEGMVQIIERCIKEGYFNKEYLV